MIYYSISQAGDSNMFFRRKQRQAAEKRQEDQIQNIHKDMFKKIDKTSRSMDKLNHLLDDPELGVTGKLFYAMGGDKRK